ncbi:MAG: hypothetical protein PHC49_14240 [Desulfuromonadaceae bacterium]|nr:hypothetical protein [Desulfuromonadaceae bacterium]
MTRCNRDFEFGLNSDVSNPLMGGEGVKLFIPNRQDGPASEARYRASVLVVLPMPQSPEMDYLIRLQGQVRWRIYQTVSAHFRRFRYIQSAVPLIRGNCR